MRTVNLTVALVLLAAMAAATLPAARATEQNQVWTGSLVDASCYLTDDTQTGNEHMGMKECGVACLKMGRPAGIVTADKKFYVLIVPSPDLAQYVGQLIRVTGKLRSGSILVDKVDVKRPMGWMAVKLSTMM
jgi:hypothetical protein